MGGIFRMSRSLFAPLLASTVLLSSPALADEGMCTIDKIPIASVNK
jgi:hypothetical protein